MEDTKNIGLSSVSIRIQANPKGSQIPFEVDDSFVKKEKLPKGASKPEDFAIWMKKLDFKGCALDG